MLTIRPQGNRARLLGDIPPALEQDLQNRFSWQDVLDQNNQVWWYSDGLMYSGVMQDVCGYIQDRGIECVIEFQPRPPRAFDWKMLEPYRVLQEPMVDALYEARFGIGQAPCGVGKTAIAAGLICKWGLPNSWILVPNERPFVQAVRTLERFTNIERIGQVSGTGIKRLGDVTVATIQSVHSELTNNPNGRIAEAWANASVVVVDEAHRGCADTFINAFDALGKVEAFVGFTATPRRVDDRHEWLESLLGKVVARITRAQAIDNRLSVPMSVYVEDMPPQQFGYVVNGKNTAANQQRRKGKSPFDKVYDEYIVRNEHRNQRGLDFCAEALQDNLSCVLSVKRIEHIHELQRLNPNVVALHGTSKARDDVFASMQKRETMLVASTLMDEAVDVASLSCVAMLAGGKSSVKLEQRIRCDRVFDGMTAQGWFAKDRGYVFFPRDTADFLTSHANENIALLKSICDESPTSEFWLNGELIAPGRKVPGRPERERRAA